MTQYIVVCIMFFLRIMSHCFRIDAVVFGAWTRSGLYCRRTVSAGLC